MENLIDVDLMKGEIHYEHLDTGSMQSVRRFAKVVQSKFSKIDVLINNGNFFGITTDSKPNIQIFCYLPSWNHGIAI